MTTDAPSPLYKRNRKAFRKYAERVWAQLEPFEKTVSTLVFEDGAAANIDLGETHLYPEAAGPWTGRQIDSYFEEPDRLGFSGPGHCNLSPVSVEVLSDIKDYVLEKRRWKMSPYPVTDVGYTFIFGIGLGYHVPELLRRKLARHIILIEPVPEFVIQSMHVIDWGRIFRQADKLGVHLHFIVGHDPVRTIEIVEVLIRGCGTTFIDGSYAYVHYYSWALKEARTLLNEKIKVFYLSSGFFEDEILMMRNTYGNLRRFSFNLVTRRARRERDLPVFVIGSGPSLDRALPVIEKWRDRAIIFSCGTSLGILLKNGIRPHLHVENENTLPLVKNLEGFRDEYGLEGIRLVASSTLRPEASRLFDKRWFYYRAPLSSSTLLSGGTEPLPYAEPLVANAASAVSTYLGFTDIYLFGVDCGRHFEGEHHSKDAIYYDDSFDIDPNDRPDAGFERVVPGSFGGQVLTTWSMDLSRRMFKALMGGCGIVLTNCSDGARIDGALPKVPAAVRLDVPIGRQEDVLSQIERDLPFYEAGDMLAGIDLHKDAEACDRFMEGFNKLIDSAKAEIESFWDFDQRLETFWHDEFADCKGVLKIIGGTLASTVRLGAFVGTRIKYGRSRKRFFDFFLETYRDSCLWMARETKVMLEEMSEGREEISEVGDVAKKKAA